MSRSAGLLAVKTGKHACSKHASQALIYEKESESAMFAKVMGNNLLFFKLSGLEDWQGSLLASEGALAVFPHFFLDPSEGESVVQVVQHQFTWPFHGLRSALP